MCVNKLMSIILMSASTDQVLYIGPLYIPWEFIMNRILGSRGILFWVYRVTVQCHTKCKLLSSLSSIIEPVLNFTYG